MNDTTANGKPELSGTVTVYKLNSISVGLKETLAKHQTKKQGGV